MAIKGQLDTIEINGEKLTALTVDGEKVVSRKEKEASIVEILESSGLDPLTSKVKVSVKGSSGLNSLFSLLISFLPLIIFGSILFFMLRQAQGNASQTFSFGRSKAKMFVGDSPTVSFADVAGVEEAKEDLQEVVEFLK